MKLAKLSAAFLASALTLMSSVVPTFAAGPTHHSTQVINPNGIYVLKQGVSADVNITGSSSNSYWTKVNYDTKGVAISLGEGETPAVKIKDYSDAEVVLENKESFLTALNKAVTGAEDDDTYTWEYQKVILENDGYHLDCIAYVPQYTVSFVTNMEGLTVGPYFVLRNDSIGEAPKEVTSNEDYSFDGWFSDEACTRPYDSNSAVKDDITLYAKWTAIEKPTPEPEETVTPEPEQPEETPNPVEPEQPGEVVDPVIPEETITPEPEQPKEEIIEPVAPESAETPSKEAPDEKEEVLDSIPEELTPEDEIEEPVPEVTNPEPAQVESTNETVISTPIALTIVNEIPNFISTQIIVDNTIPLAANTNEVQKELAFEEEEEVIEILDEKDEELTILEEEEVPLARNSEEEPEVEEGCIIHIIMYIIIVIYGLYYAIISIFKDKKKSKYYLTRILACLILIALIILMLFSRCSLDIWVFLLGELICLCTFIAAKHLKENKEDKKN